MSSLFLADAILIPPCSLISPTSIIKVRGLQKSTETSNRKNYLLVNEKRRCRDG